MLPALELLKQGLLMGIRRGEEMWCGIEIKLREVI